MYTLSTSFCYLTIALEDVMVIEKLSIYFSNNTLHGFLLRCMVLGKQILSLSVVNKMTDAIEYSFITFFLQINLFVGCGTGYHGPNCFLACRYPNYGRECQEECYCKEKNCNHVTGCLNGEK